MILPAARAGEPSPILWRPQNAPTTPNRRLRYSLRVPLSTYLVAALGISTCSNVEVRMGFAPVNELSGMQWSVERRDIMQMGETV